jgi:hypothetical protein
MTTADYRRAKNELRAVRLEWSLITLGAEYRAMLRKPGKLQRSFEQAEKEVLAWLEDARTYIIRSNWLAP